MNEKFIIKSPELNRYFVGFDNLKEELDVLSTDEKAEAFIFDSVIEALVWLKKIDSDEMKYKKIDSIKNITWNVILVSFESDSTDFNEIMTWCTTKK